MAINGSAPALNDPHNVNSTWFFQAIGLGRKWIARTQGIGAASYSTPSSCEFLQFWYIFLK